jgi:probable rRNA maturation factor
VRLAEHVLVAERVDAEAEMSVLFVDEPAIAELNERFLGGRGPTDVLAFPLDDVVIGGRQPDQGGRGPGTGIDAQDPPIVIGDIVVCPTVAARQAADRAGSTEDELALLVVHGTLHLLRYDHVEPDDAARMQQRERELLAEFAAEAAEREGP